MFLSFHEPVWREFGIALFVVTAAALVGLMVQGVLFWLLHRLAKRGGTIATLTVARATAPSRLVFPLLAIVGVLPALVLPRSPKLGFEHVLGLALIAAVTWAAIALVNLGADVTKRRGTARSDDALRARQIATRVDLLARATITIVTLVGVGIALTTFPAIRAVGATLLASAGLIGIVAGFATRPIFANLFAGIQIALTQPIRLGDALLVEGEYGHVESIESTFVVVRLWDLRRLILPLTYFIDKPFQNWTYDSSALTGSVMLYVQRPIDFDDFRERAREIVTASPLYDGNVFEVAVTDVRETAIEIRVLCSARDAAALFDLRCYLREKLVALVGVAATGGVTSVFAGAPPTNAET